MTYKLQKQTAFSRMVSEHLVKILAFKIRSPNTANPKPKRLSVAKTTHPHRRALSTAWWVCWRYTSKTELNTLTVKITVHILSGDRHWMLTVLAQYFWTRNPSRSSKVSNDSDYSLVSSKTSAKYYHLTVGGQGQAKWAKVA